MTKLAVHRHQCMVYEGPASRVLPVLVKMVRHRLDARERCLYINSPPMVAGVRSLLYAAGIDVEDQVVRGALVLSSDKSHLIAGRFDVDRMIDMMDAAVETALADGYAGLFATGDMSWEFGAENDFSKLLEYEWRLEQLFQKHPLLSGICQYHRDLLPREALREGLVSHASMFINDTISRMNPHYVLARSPGERQVTGAAAELDRALAVLLAVDA